MAERALPLSAFEPGPAGVSGDLKENTWLLCSSSSSSRSNELLLMCPAFF